jgi:hypothetical protein
MKKFSEIVAKAGKYAEMEYESRIQYYRCSAEKKNLVYDKLLRRTVEEMLNAYLKTKG